MMMTLDRAGSLVLADRRPDPDLAGLSDADVLAAAVSDVALDELAQHVDLDDETDVAYLIYLAYHVGPTREQLRELLLIALDGDLDRDPLPHQHVWIKRLRAGDLY